MKSNRSAIRFDQADDQAQQSRFAAAARPDEHSGFARARYDAESRTDCKSAASGCRRIAVLADARSSSDQCDHVRSSRSTDEARRNRIACNPLGRGEIENAKELRVVRPHVRKTKVRLGGERRETFLAVLVGILGNDFLSGVKMKFMTGDVNRLIGFADRDASRYVPLRRCKSRGVSRR